MMYLVITPTQTIYAGTATQAAVEAGFGPWERLKVINAMAALNPGDELKISEDVSIIIITGVDKDYVA